MKPQVVIPTIRSEEFFRDFLVHWKREFEGCHVIVVEDRPNKTLEGLLEAFVDDFSIYDWNDIEDTLGGRSWIIPRNSDCVRSFGFLMALKEDPLFILTLDDDTKPTEPGHIQSHWNNLTNYDGYKNYIPTLKPPLKPRGYISDIQDIAISHGGWVGTPDFDAETQIEGQSKVQVEEKDFNAMVLPKGVRYSMCGMNLAFRPEVTKYMYFGLQGKLKVGKGKLQKLPVDRAGDIWAGFYSKHHLDKKNMSVYIGGPYVEHTRASNPWTNHEKEEKVWDYQTEFLTSLERYDHFEGKDMWYWDQLSEAYLTWQELVAEFTVN